MFLKMKLMVLLILLQSCSTEDNLTDLFIEVKMLGVFKEAASSTGEFEPISQTYTLTDVVMTDPNGETYQVFEETQPVTIRINKFTQLLLKVPMKTEWEKQTFSSIVFTFDSEVLGVSKLEKNHTLTLESEQVSYTTQFETSAGQGLEFIIGVNWQGTVNRDESTSVDTMTLPDFEISVDKT